MYSAIWTYPWDILGEGADVVLDRVAAAGLQGVSLAAAYHTVRALCPHDPKRAVYHGEGGVLYFRHEPEFFRDTRIRPVESALLAEGDALRLLCAAVAGRGIRVHAWTVLHHNTRLGTAYPDCSLEDAFGDRYPFGLCPAHPDVRAYTRALVSALAAVDGLDIVELESLGYMGMDHSGHHAKAGIELDALHRFLLSVCFCRWCRERMATAGADPEAARAAVVAEMRAYFGGGRQFEGAESLEALHEVLGQVQAEGVLAGRADAVLSLLGELRPLVQPPKRLSVMVAASPLVTGAAAAIPLEAARGQTDILLRQAFAKESEAIRADLAMVAAQRGSTPLYAGLQAVEPFVRGAANVAASVRAARDAGAEGVQFYHYGLMPLENLDWIRTALTAS